MRSTAIVFLLISLFSVEFARSQSTELVVQGQGGKLFLPHAVVVKENWYSIGRLYNINPKELAAFNGLAMDKPLDIGQELKIPLTAANFSQSGQKPAPAETLVPVYHIIQEKEWMYRISVNHNKVPIPSLEKWNNINKDQVKAGMHLIVGFLKVKTAQSSLAAGGSTPRVAAVTNPPVSAKTEFAANTDAGSPAKTNPVSTTTQSDKPAVEKPLVEKHPVEKPLVNKPVADKPVPDKSVAEKPVTEKPIAERRPTENLPAEKTQDDKSLAGTPAPSAPHFNGGYFKTDFSGSGKSLSGPAGTFKSTSGWQDGKYYALMNNVPVGTIVKITVTSTNKTIYAKILGQLPDMKESAGMTVRMSNAAAGELGEGEGKFNVEVKY